MAKYSIILPVRNGGTYVKDCIKSILDQDYNDFNCIVLDNCSEDGTLEWLQSIDDRRLRIITSEQPLSIEESWARIKSVDKDEYMTMVGHDDIFSKDYLSKMDELISKHPHASLYQTHFRYIDKDGLPTRACLPMNEVEKAHEFLACQMSNTINSTGTGYMMRSSYFDELGGMPTHYSNLIFADYELWIKLTFKAYKATTIAESFYYREHMSVSRITNGEQYSKAFHEYIRFLVRLKDDREFSIVINRYGHGFLMHMCESLSHRLLKTPEANRSVQVKDLIEEFKGYAQLLLPDKVFDPMTVPRIKYAAWLDSNPLTRNGFRVINQALR